MKKYKRLFASLLLVSFLMVAIPGSAQNNISQTVDVWVYGGSSAGVIAAYTAKKMGKRNPG